ncbi:MAG: DUF3710 domain-containing protein [Micrococcales bacterium]
MAEFGEIGPFDSEALGAVKPYVDFGSIRIEPRQDVSISVEIDQQSGRVLFITLDCNGSKLQLMAIAAPKSDGIWTEVRHSIAERIRQQGGACEETVGALGVQLDAKLPLIDEEGRPSGYRIARFVGFDGPRWCLRGEIGGAALGDFRSENEIVDLFRSVIVHRGDEPLPPNEPLPLKVPTGSVVPPGVKQA